MKNKKNFHGLTAALASLLALLMVTPLTAFAYTGDSGNSGDTAQETQAGTVQTETVAAQTEQTETEAVETSQSDDTQTTQVGTVTTNGGNLNLRSGASTSYDIIGQLPNGDMVTVIGEENGWYKVIVPEKEGFVYGGYLKVSDVVITQEEPAEKSVAPLTPDGNLDLVDDIIQTSDGKEFLTVQSKNDNTFYIVIDRDKDDENVYFLNLVDEADLMALMEDGEVTLKCTCADRCEAGDVDMTCPVCKNNLYDCTGEEKEEPAETEEPAEPEPAEPEQASSAAGSSTMLLAVVLIAALGIGGAVYFLKFKKQKPDTKGPTDLDDYDFGEDDDEDEVEYVSEDEAEQDNEN